MNILKHLVPFTIALSAPPALAEDFVSQVTPADRLVVKEGFKVERLYSVPKKNFGSWNTLCEDDKGRLIAGDQYGGLYRFERPAPGQALQDGDLEKIDLDIGHAWGLCYAFDALYVVVNDKAHGGRGLYRLTDTNGDDKFDKKELLKKFQETGGEHGCHAVIPSPDGKSLYICSGNQTGLPGDHNGSRVTECWGEDTLQPRVYGRGHMKGALAPRGWVAKTDPDGKTWEIIATGFRNEYDIAFNLEGELFTYDADMEWDINAPWYRPTRINHVISGGEYGWRNGSAKWPEYYSDSFGAVVNVGPGSPTGVVFGTGAKFPAKYQKAFFACDWSYGKLYAIHLAPDGASYSGEVEEFIAGQPLPLTDICISQADGAMYFAVGGRRVQSGIYRVTYTGSESTTPVKARTEGAKARAERQAIEAYHLKPDPSAVAKVWKHLNSPDRALRFAARTAIEKVAAKEWAQKALTEKVPFARLGALLSLARVGDKSHQPDVIQALLELQPDQLNQQERFDLFRAYALTFIRLGAPNPEQKEKIANQVLPLYPSSVPAENIELSDLLGYLEAPGVLERSIKLLETAPTQEEQIAIAKNIRLVKTGWSNELEEKYFKWFVKAGGYKGGPSLQNFIRYIKNDAMKRLSPERKKALAPILNARPPAKPPLALNRDLKFVKNWTMKDLKPLLASGLEGGRSFQNGREMFSAATCYACHRFNQEGGGIGPDLTSAGGKFSPHDLLESILEPSKEISDQYGSVTFKLKNGTEVAGRIANLSGDSYRIITDLMAPGAMTSIKTSDIKSTEPTPVSMMPPGLLNMLEDEDIMDLLAYILSKGDKDNPLFQKQ
jgi:putative heme-binding domain-containing protein